VRLLIVRRSCFSKEHGKLPVSGRPLTAAKMRHGGGSFPSNIKCDLAVIIDFFIQVFLRYCQIALHALMCSFVFVCDSDVVSCESCHACSVSDVT
jgi:hypothetical protein